MSLLVKAVLIALFFALVVALFSALPLTSDHPLDPAFTTAVMIIFAYTFAWAQVFTAINYLLFVALATLGLELGIFLFRGVAWILGKIAARFVG